MNDQKILEESYRFSVDALSKEGFMPTEAFSALVEQLVSQKSIDETASKKLPVTAYFDNRYVNESWRRRDFSENCGSKFKVQVSAFENYNLQYAI